MGLFPTTYWDSDGRIQEVSTRGGVYMDKAGSIPYRAFAQLGLGSFKEVFLAKGRSSDQPVAVALPRRRDRRLATGHHRTIQSLGLHENVLRVFDARSSYISMEYVPRPLSWFEFLDFDIARELLVDVAAGLDFLHSGFIVHCDLKADNVLVKEDGGRLIAKITDFDFVVNLSEPLESHFQGFSPEYAAPEVLMGQRCGSKSDVWSLGVLAYGLLSGTPRETPPFMASSWSKCERRPDGGEDYSAVAANWRDREPIELPGAGAEVTAIVERILTFDYQDRPSASVVHDELVGRRDDTGGAAAAAAAAAPKSELSD